MSERKIEKRVGAVVIAAIYGAGEIPEVWLGVDEVLKAFGGIDEETAKRTGLMVALTIGLVAATQGGLLVYFHAVRKLLKAMRQATPQQHVHDSESCDSDDSCDHEEGEDGHSHDPGHVANIDEGEGVGEQADNADPQIIHGRHAHEPTCGETTTKILAYTLMGLGMVAQYGLNAACWDQALTYAKPDIGLGWRIGVPLTLAAGRATGSWLFHGHHTYRHIAHTHQHRQPAQNEDSSLCCMRTILGLTAFLYLALWIGHAGQANFEIVETREYGLNITNQTDALNQDEHPVAYWSVRGVELFIAAVIGLQMAFVEGHHVRELKSTYNKFSQLSLKEKVVSGGTAVVGAVAHTLPEVAGLMMISREFGLNFGGMLALVLVLGLGELFIATALHLPYNIKVASWCCRANDEDYDEVPEHRVEQQNIGEEEVQLTAVSRSKFTYASLTG